MFQGNLLTINQKKADQYANNQTVNVIVPGKAMEDRGTDPDLSETPYPTIIPHSTSEHPSPPVFSRSVELLREIEILKSALAIKITGRTVDQRTIAYESHLKNLIQYVSGYACVRFDHEDVDCNCNGKPDITYISEIYVGDTEETITIKFKYLESGSCYSLIESYGISQKLCLPDPL